MFADDAERRASAQDEDVAGLEGDPNHTVWLDNHNHRTTADGTVTERNDDGRGTGPELGREDDAARGHAMSSSSMTRVQPQIATRRVRRDERSHTTSKSASHMEWKPGTLCSDMIASSREAHAPHRRGTGHGVCNQHVGQGCAAGFTGDRSIAVGVRKGLVEMQGSEQKICPRCGDDLR
jgi:hypothetical protein